MNNEAESRRFEQAKTAAIGESKAFKMGDAGLEPNSLTIDSAGAYGEHPLEGEAKAEAVSARFDSDDADLAIIVAAWPTLPAERRQTIVGLVMGFEPVEAPPARQNGKQARYVGPDGLIVDGEKSRSRTPRKARR